jgi:hypothetical protein
LALEIDSLRLEDPPAFAARVDAAKAAADNGFRLVREVRNGWVGFASTTAPGEIFIAHTLSGQWLFSVEHSGVARELGPSNFAGPGLCTVSCNTLDELYFVINRTYRLSVSLPQLPLDAFKKQTATLPRSTEAERLVVQRVGQDIFRNALMDYWNNTCPLTGITEPALLRASHIIPWADCETDDLRLNVYNGLLLSSLWDAAFDAGLVGFTAEGAVLVSADLGARAAAALHIESQPTLRGLGPPHEAMLKRHRERCHLG